MDDMKYFGIQRIFKNAQKDKIYTYSMLSIKLQDLQAKYQV